MNKNLLYVLSLFILCSCDNISNGSIDEQSSASKWNYDEVQDVMSSSKSHYATLEAEEPFYFSYANYTRVYPELMIRNENNVNKAMISVAFPIPTASGAFYIAHNHDLTVRVKFNKEESQVFTCSPTADGNDDTIFIDSADTFISKLKSTDTALIECLLTVTPPKKIEKKSANDFHETQVKPYQRTYVFDFRVSGLKWNYK